MINYRVGDVLDIEASNLTPQVIAHVCNDQGMWGAGFVLSLSRKWWQPELMYRAWRDNDPETFKLGEIQPVFIKKNLFVVNMIAQDMGSQPRIKYHALEDCLYKLENFMDSPDAELHIPRIGAGLAGGEWSTIEALIKHHIFGDVFVYDLPKEKDSDEHV